MNVPVANLNSTTLIEIPLPVLTQPDPLKQTQAGKINFNSSPTSQTESDCKIEYVQYFSIF